VRSNYTENTNLKGIENMTREEVINWLKYLQHEEHLKADSIVPSCTEIALQMAIEALNQPEIVRCKDCKHYDGEKRTE